jgi:hypothetical protein
MASFEIPTTTSFRPPAVSDVDVRGFWGNRIDAVADRTAMILYDRCVAAGMLDQIDPDRPVPEIRMPFHLRSDGTPDTVNVQMFWDSDVAKVIETAAYALYRKPTPDLEAKIDAIIDMFHKLQEPDGYVNSWFIRMQPGQRWKNLRDCHELYCAGHLMEAAVAYFHATGKRKLLDVMCRYADHIDRTFGPRPDQKPGYCGHEEVELALVRLGRATGEQRYLDLARFFVDQRGQQPHYFDVEAAARGADPKQFRHRTYEYNQSHLPVRQQKKVTGHAVRAMYLYSGMADVATEFGDDSLTEALKILWDDLTGKQMYVTGGIGPAASNEGFTDYYDLPNESAYAETCAAVGLTMWASRHHGTGALQWGAVRPLDRRGQLLLRQPAGKPRQPSSLDLASLPLLSAQRRADRGGDRQLYVRRRGRAGGGPSLWRQHGPAVGERRAADADPAHRLSVGRPHRHHRRSRHARRLPARLARAGLVPQTDPDHRRRHRRHRGGRGEGIPADRSPLAWRRLDPAGFAHGCARRPRQPQGESRSRPRRVDARAAGLLRRGGR